MKKESEVGNNMLLVSEVLFHINICKCECSNQALIASDKCYIDLINMLCKTLSCMCIQVSGVKLYWLILCIQNNLKPVTCRCRLSIYSAWLRQNLDLKSFKITDIVMMSNRHMTLFNSVNVMNLRLLTQTFWLAIICPTK